MGIKFEGQVLKFGTVDKCNRKFAPDCKITFPEKIPVAYNFDMDEIIGHADISKVEDGLKGVVSLFDTNILPGNSISLADIIPGLRRMWRITSPSSILVDWSA